MERSVTGGMGFGFMASVAAALAGGGGGLPSLKSPAPEKYPGQARAYLRGAWVGDGVPSNVSTKLAWDKRRLARRLEKVKARARMGLTG